MSLLQNIVSFIGLFCKRDYNFKEPTNRSHPIQPVADMDVELLSKDFQFSTRRTRILMGFIISTAYLHGTNRKSHGQNPGTLTKN